MLKFITFLVMVFGISQVSFATQYCVEPGCVDSFEAGSAGCNLCTACLNQGGSVNVVTNSGTYNIGCSFRVVKAPKGAAMSRVSAPVSPKPFPRQNFKANGQP